MSKKEAIKNAVSAVTAHGFTIPDSIKKMVDDIENPVYRVAVVGKFQVGKSTLINKVFLGDSELLPCLAEGNGWRCQTAVATDVEYGNVTKLEIDRWNEDGQEEIVSSKDNPNAADVLAVTVGENEEKRTSLAKKTSRVRLTVPNEALKGYTILDTPGLDDPNKELLVNTTYRVIPSADVALVVVEPKMLDEIVDDLVRKTLIGGGLSKMMVLVSYNADKQNIDRETRDGVVKDIKAQLAKAGREDVPVLMYCYNDKVDGMINNVEALRKEIRAYLDANALPGRMERVAFAVREFLADCELKIAGELKALDASDAEKEALKQKIEKQVDEFKARCEKSFGRLTREIEELKDESEDMVKSAVRPIFSKFYSDLEKLPNVSDIKKEIDAAEETLRNKLVQPMAEIQRYAKTGLDGILERYEGDCADGLTEWNRILIDDFGVERPFLAKIPAIVWEAINVGVLDYFLPLGWLTALCARWLGGDKLKLTDYLVRPLLLNSLKENLNQAAEDLSVSIGAQIGQNVDKVFWDLKKSIEQSSQAQVERMRSVVCEQQPTSDRSALEAAKSEIGNAIAGL